MRKISDLKSDYYNFPKVSVIIPSYNHRLYIEAAIKSVWRQTYPNIELIVIDDGSTDDSKSLVEALILDSPISMSAYYKENEGICKTLNRGIKLSKGEYLCFLASDDLYPASRIEEHVQFLVSNSEVQACCGYLKRIDEFGNHSPGLKSKPKRSENQFLDTIKRRSGLSLQGATFRSKLFEKYSFDPNLYFEDWDFYIRLTREYYVEPVDIHSCDYRVLASGANRNAHKMILARKQIVKKYIVSDCFSLYERWVLVSEVMMANSKSEYNVGRYSKAFCWLLPAVFCNPLSCISDLMYICSLIKRSILVLR